ncbi:uncharacterized protein LOC109838308 [Asparagus officinalis]|uniref:uncharacterized protein LOC109838308 n=1 Tax=Asparagus officinalis TaxID=4686 RepID=UPI00098DF4C3|nr:uncharacterized protein LOC109838308 [Asparagus officinalis]
MKSILENGPWFFGSRPILLKPWNIDEDLEKSKESVYPVWIQLPGLGLSLWNAKSINKIAGIIGKPIITNMLIANRQRLAYARVLEEINLPSALPDEITIKGPDRKNILQKVYYELKPRWCEDGVNKIQTNTHVLPDPDLLVQKPIQAQSVLQMHIQAQYVPQMPVNTSQSVGIEQILGNDESNGKKRNLELRKCFRISAGKNVVHVSQSDFDTHTHSGKSWMLMQRGKSKKRLSPINSFSPLAGIDSRKALWTELLQVHQTVGNTPWLLCGDFNTMINNNEKLGRIALTDANTKDFNSFIEDIHLLHLKTLGCFFTWNNKQDHDARVWCRLDRALVNDSWTHKYNSSHVEFLLPNFSDHSLALVTIYKEDI